METQPRDGVSLPGAATCHYMLFLIQGNQKKSTGPSNSSRQWSVHRQHSWGSCGNSWAISGGTSNQDHEWGTPPYHWKWCSRNIWRSFLITIPWLGIWSRKWPEIGLKVCHFYKCLWNTCSPKSQSSFTSSKSLWDISWLSGRHIYQAGFSGETANEYLSKNILRHLWWCQELHCCCSIRRW